MEERSKYYTIIEMRKKLNISISQIYKLLKKEDGIIKQGVKKYKEDILFNLMLKKIERNINGL